MALLLTGCLVETSSAPFPDEREGSEGSGAPPADAGPVAPPSPPFPPDAAPTSDPPPQAPAPTPPPGTPGGACNTCHGSQDGGRASWATLGGAHAAHLANPSMDCTTCHSGTVANDPDVISNPALHMNGRVDVRMPDGVTFANADKQCAGLCHDAIPPFPHLNTPWNALAGD